MIGLVEGLDHEHVVSEPRSVADGRGVRSGWEAAVRVLAVVVAAAAHLAVGFVYLTSGLVAPLWVVVALLVVWMVLGGFGVGLARRRSWWVLAVPVAAAAVWLAVISAGGALLGWRA